MSNSNKKIDRNVKYSFHDEKKFVRPAKSSQKADINSIDDFIQGLKNLMNENPKKASVHLQQGLKPLKQYQAQHRNTGKKAESYKKNTDKKQSRQTKEECEKLRDGRRNRSYSSSSGYREEMGAPYKKGYHTSSASSSTPGASSYDSMSEGSYFGEESSNGNSSYRGSSYDSTSYSKSYYQDFSDDDSSYRDSSSGDSSYDDSSYDDSSYDDSSYDDSSYDDSSYDDSSCDSSSYDECSSDDSSYDDSSCQSSTYRDCSSDSFSQDEYSDSDDSDEEGTWCEEDDCTDTVLSLLSQIAALQNSLSNDIQRILTFYMSGMPDVTNSINGILMGVFKNCWYNVKSPSTGTNSIYSVGVLQAIEADNTQTTPDIFEMLLEFIDSLGNQNCRCEVDNDDICENSLMYQLTGIQQTESQVTVVVEDASFTGYISKVYNGILYMVDSLLTPMAVYCIPVCNINGYEVAYYD